MLRERLPQFSKVTIPILDHNSHYTVLAEIFES
jgi:hypothetical protein